MYQRYLFFLIHFVSIFLFSCSSDSSVNENNSDNSEISDIDGNKYQTVKIGTQLWIAENLKVTRFNNGDTIPNITVDSVWFNLTFGAWCFYNNNDAHDSKYGKMYNWYAVNDSRGLAPRGWHIPTDDDWQVLESYLGIEQSELELWKLRGTNEGEKLKKTGFWGGQYSDSINVSGFSALPGGLRMGTGQFVTKSYLGLFWSSTETDNEHAIYRMLDKDTSAIYRYFDYKTYGLSIRCLKD